MDFILSEKAWHDKECGGVGNLEKINVKETSLCNPWKNFEMLILIKRMLGASNWYIFLYHFISFHLKLMFITILYTHSKVFRFSELILHLM